MNQFGLVEGTIMCHQDPLQGVRISSLAAGNVVSVSLEFTQVKRVSLTRIMLPLWGSSALTDGLGGAMKILAPHLNSKNFDKPCQLECFYGTRWLSCRLSCGYVASQPLLLLNAAFHLSFRQLVIQRPLSNNLPEWNFHLRVSSSVNQTCNSPLLIKNM